MGLLVVDHLQPVFETAEVLVGGGELVRGGLRQPVRLGQSTDRAAGLAQAQARVAPAGYELLRLREEFDLANAASAELDVVPGDRDLAVPTMGVYLALDRVNIGNGGEIEVLAPHERSNTSEKGVAGAGGRQPPGAP